MFYKLPSILKMQGHWTSENEDNDVSPLYKNVFWVFRNNIPVGVLNYIKINVLSKSPYILVR